MSVGCSDAGATAQALTDTLAVSRSANFMMEITLTPVNLGIIDYLVENTSPDRVMYGSDLPMRDPRPQLGWAVFSRLKLEEKLKVLGGNAKRLLDRIRAANA